MSAIRASGVSFTLDTTHGHIGLRLHDDAGDVVAIVICSTAEALTIGERLTAMTQQSLAITTSAVPVTGALH